MPKKLTTEIFKKNCQEKHGDSYNYDGIEYVSGETIIKVFCNKHNDYFEVESGKHMRGLGCKKCNKIEKTENEIKTNTENFIKKAINKFGDKFSFENTIYTGNYKLLKVNCKIHGEVNITPLNFFDGCGCQKCASEARSKHFSMGSEKFIEKAKAVHGEKYDYSLVEYKNNRTKVLIICPTHGKFNHAPNTHLMGHGCAKCSGNYNMDTNDFIKKAKKIHGDEYDYSKVNFTKNNCRIIITCKKHGDIEINSTYHLKGRKCVKCNKEKISPRTIPFSEFKERAIKLHGDKFSYYEDQYKNIVTKTIIHCKNCGKDFTQSPSGHLVGRGCRDCSSVKRGEEGRLSQEEFIMRCKEIHGDLYDYSEAVYSGGTKKIIIKCQIHGPSSILAYYHMIGHGCKKCNRIKFGMNHRLATEDFVEKAREIHGNEYDYSKTNYIKSTKKVEIICKEHGSFHMTPNSHLSKKSKCQYCTKTAPLTKEIFEERCNKIHNNKYDYSLVDSYIHADKVKIICPIHGIFQQTVNGHISGNGCLKCRTSKGEMLTEQILKTLNIDFVHPYKEPKCINIRALTFDFKIQAGDKIGFIEYQGIQHYGPAFNDKWNFALILKRDNIKRKYCADNNIPLLELKYNQNNKMLENIQNFLKEFNS